MSTAMNGNIGWFIVFRLSPDRGYQTIMKECRPCAGREQDYSWKFERTTRFRKCNLTSITAKVFIT
ncbi:MAG: hypothetical protein WBH05_05130, partial [Syntrophobacteria bacterium]